jgi:hypothetical protein
MAHIVRNAFYARATSHRLVYADSAPHVIRDATALD